MKTITYNPETHVLVPREPSEDMLQAATADSCWEDMNPPPSVAYRLMLAAAPQPETAWAQAHRLALELECLLLDTKDNATVSKWWDSGMEALSEYQQLKPGAKEEADAWAKMRKETL